MVVLPSNSIISILSPSVLLPTNFIPASSIVCINLGFTWRRRLAVIYTRIQEKFSRIHVCVSSRENCEIKVPHNDVCVVPPQILYFRIISLQKKIKLLKKCYTKYIQYVSTCYLMTWYFRRYLEKSWKLTPVKNKFNVIMINIQKQLALLVIQVLALNKVLRLPSLIVPPIWPVLCSGMSITCLKTH